MRKTAKELKHEEEMLTAFFLTQRLEGTTKYFYKTKKLLIGKYNLLNSLNPLNLLNIFLTRTQSKGNETRRRHKDEMLAAFF